MECENVSINSTVSWRELNGIIYLTIIFNEILKEPWIDRLGRLVPGEKIILIQERAESILLSPDFKTDKPAVYEIAILKDLFDSAFDSRRMSTKEIVDKALLLDFNFLDPEVACIAREKISHKDLLSMGFDSLNFVHKPINDSKGNPSLLRLSQGNHYDGCDHDMIGASDYEPCGRWLACANFAFLVSKTYL